MKNLKHISLNSKLSSSPVDILCKIVWVPFGRYACAYNITKASNLRRVIENPTQNSTKNCLKLKLKSYNF